MTEQKEATELIVTCPQCKSENKLGVCVSEWSVADLTAHGLLCPDCGVWTHSFWMNDALQAKNARLRTLGQIYKDGPTPGRWTTYETARVAYKKDFERFQSRKGIG